MDAENRPVHKRKGSQGLLKVMAQMQSWFGIHLTVCGCFKVGLYSKE